MPLIFSSEPFWSNNFTPWSQSTRNDWTLLDSVSWNQHVPDGQFDACGKYRSILSHEGWKLIYKTIPLPCQDLHLTWHKIIKIGQPMSTGPYSKRPATSPLHVIWGSTQISSSPCTRSWDQEPLKRRKGRRRFLKISKGWLVRIGPVCLKLRTWQVTC